MEAWMLVFAAVYLAIGGAWMWYNDARGMPGYVRVVTPVGAVLFWPVGACLLFVVVFGQKAGLDRMAPFRRLMAAIWRASHPPCPRCGGRDCMNPWNFEERHRAFMDRVMASPHDLLPPPIIRPTEGDDIIDFDYGPKDAT
jgi:hypothetical protein